MAFFKNSGPITLIPEALRTAVKAAEKTTYANANYYIAEMSTEGAQFQIQEPEPINNSHDTTKIVGSTGPSDYGTYYNINAAKLFITHIPTGYAVVFPAILTSYAESFKPNFSAEQLYGRMDPVQKYQNTSRTVSVAFTVIGYDEDHAHRNVHALSSLAEFLYPVYDESENSFNNATSISESPLWRVKFANLIQNNKGIGYIDGGLMVAPTSFSFEPNLEAGFFIVDKEHLFPKEIKVALSFNAIHENTLGWVKNNEKGYDWFGNINIDATVFPWGDKELSPIISPTSANRPIIRDSGLVVAAEAANTTIQQ